MCMFFFKQKTAYDVRISDWRPDVCSSDLLRHILRRQRNLTVLMEEVTAVDLAARRVGCGSRWLDYDWLVIATGATHADFGHDEWAPLAPALRSDERRVGQRGGDWGSVRWWTGRSKKKKTKNKSQNQ